MRACVCVCLEQPCTYISSLSILPLSRHRVGVDPAGCLSLYNCYYSHILHILSSHCSQAACAHLKKCSHETRSVHVSHRYYLLLATWSSPSKVFSHSVSSIICSVSCVIIHRFLHSAIFITFCHSSLPTLLFALITILSGRLLLLLLLLLFLFLLILFKKKWIFEFFVSFTCTHQPIAPPCKNLFPHSIFLIFSAFLYSATGPSWIFRFMLTPHACHVTSPMFSLPHFNPSVLTIHCVLLSHPPPTVLPLYFVFTVTVSIRF